MAQPRLSTRRKLIFAVITTVAALLIVEIALRLVFDVPDDWYVYDRRLAWRPRPNYHGPIIRGGRAFDGRSYLRCDSAQARAGRQPRIVVVGDSTAMGYGVTAEQTFAEQLDAMLDDRAVINLAVNGYTSLQSLLRLEAEFERLQPTAVIVACGFNDRRYVLAPERIDSRERYRQVGRLAPAWYESSSLFRGARRLLALTTPLPAPASLADLPPRVGPESFEANLRAIVDLAQRHQARALLLVLHDNPAQMRDLSEGSELAEDGDYERAIPRLRQAIDATNMFTDLARIQLAAAYRAAGEPEQATAALLLREPIDSLHGGRLVRSNREYTEIIRRVAADTSAVAIEAGTALDQAGDVYLDFCHFNEAGHRIVAELIHEALDTGTIGFD